MIVYITIVMYENTQGILEDRRLMKRQLKKQGQQVVPRKGGTCGLFRSRRINKVLCLAWIPTGPFGLLTRCTVRPSGHQ